jgi:hypothetical protein
MHKRDLSHRSSGLISLSLDPGAPGWRRFAARSAQFYGEEAMKGADKLIGLTAAVLLMFSLSSVPAKAQFGGGGGGDMMTQMAPMLEMMKAKMGKRRFAQMMQTMGPMMGGMMGGDGGGGFGGMMGGGGFGGMSNMMGGGFGGGDMSGMMNMIGPMMSMANLGGGGFGGFGGGHRRHRRH